MKLVNGAIMAAMFGLAGSCLLASSAQARVVCNAEGDCWHAHEDYEYAPSFGLTVHPDDWHWEGASHRWREHEGRGYWHGGNWQVF